MATPRWALQANPDILLLKGEIAEGEQRWCCPSCKAVKPAPGDNPALFRAHLLLHCPGGAVAPGAEVARGRACMLLKIGSHLPLIEWNALPDADKAALLVGAPLPAPPGIPLRRLPPEPAAHLLPLLLHLPYE